MDRRKVRISWRGDVDDRFTLWLTKGSFEWEHDGFPLWSAFHHLQSFWTYRELGNIHFIHYNDLINDLDGEMRRLARLFGVDIQKERWPSIVEAASFYSMKRDSEKAAPNAHKGLLQDPSKFFNRGTSGQWQDVLSDESLALYEKIKSERLEHSLAEWIDQGSHDAS